MNIRVALPIAMAVAASFSVSSHAAVIDFEAPTAMFGPAYSQDGYTVTNSGGDNYSLGNWILNGNSGYNANGANATIFVNFRNTTTVLTKNGGGSFDFSSIALADVYNSGTGGDVGFTFNYASGGSSSQVVTIGNAPGLQTFAFNQLGLKSVEFTALTTYGPFLQFDLVGVNGAGAGAVPEPAAWAMMIGGFGLIGATMRRKKAAVSFA